MFTLKIEPSIAAANTERVALPDSEHYVRKLAVCVFRARCEMGLPCEAVTVLRDGSWHDTWNGVSWQSENSKITVDAKPASVIVILQQSETNVSPWKGK